MRYKMILSGVLSVNLLFAGISPRKLEDGFKLIDRWVFPDAKVGKYIYDAEVDSRGYLVFMGLKWFGGVKVVNKREIKNFAPVGEGPGEVKHFIALFKEGNYIVIIENLGRFTFYKYTEKDYVFYKVDRINNAFQIVRDGTLCGGKWYLTGYVFYTQKSKMGLKVGQIKKEGYFLKIFDKNKKEKKNGIHLKFKGIYRLHLLKPYIKKHRGKAFIILDFSPHLYIYDCKTDALLKEFDLPMPSFYKPVKWFIPLHPGVMTSPAELEGQIERWRTSFSRITNMVFYDDYLVLQIRTASKNLPKFALLFYDAKDFKLREIYFTEHLLLAQDNGRFYFFENGSPGVDDSADLLAIRIYSKRSR